MTRLCGHRRRERGAALLVTMCLVLLIMLLGASATRAALYAEKAARGERDHGIAFRAAEAALLDAERDIEGGADRSSLRAAMFDDGVAATFPDGCGAGRDNPALGLCKLVAAPRPPSWLALPLAEAEAAVDYGTFTGALLSTGQAWLPSRLPRYIIEPIPLARAGSNASKAPVGAFRITAIGFGVDARTHVVLQSMYLRTRAEGA